jgi:hypothetical protein
MSRRNHRDGVFDWRVSLRISMFFEIAYLFAAEGAMVAVSDDDQGWPRPDDEAPADSGLGGPG